MKPRDQPEDPAPGDRQPPRIRPGAITRMAQQRRARYAIEIDGHAGVTLSEEVVARAGLGIGDELDEAAIAELLDADEKARAVEAALAFLSYRPRSEREVRDRLRRGRYGQEAIAHALARLRDWHYLDDEDFARRWVENRATHRPRGRRLLQQELRHKGIDSETAREVIADADLDEAAAAEALARRQLAKYAGEDPAVVRRRLGAYLARRGYGYDVVRGALDRALGEAEDGASDPSL
jgi:regulatory protein